MDTAILAGLADITADVPVIAGAAIGVGALLFGIGLLWNKARHWAR